MLLLETYTPRIIVRDVVTNCGSVTYPVSGGIRQCCGLRPSALGQDRSETKKIGLDLGHGLAHSGLGLGLAGLVLCCETRSCHARRHNDLEGYSNFSSTIYSFSILCL